MQEVTSQVPEMVDGVLGVLAERFGTTGAHLWGVLIRQAYVDAAVWVVAFVTCVILLRIAGVRLGSTEEFSDGEFAWTAVTIVLASATGICLVGALLAIGGALNPEYFALNKILSAIP